MNRGKDRARVWLQNILVATDFSEASEKAFEYAIKIARRYAATIHLLHVIRPGIATEVLTPQELPADLMVIDVRREESWATHLPDDASSIVTQAPCPVLTVHTVRTRTS